MKSVSLMKSYPSVRHLAHGGARLLRRGDDAAVEVRLAVRAPGELRAGQEQRGPRHLAAARRARSGNCSGVPIISRAVVTPFASMMRSSSGATESGTAPSESRCACMSARPGIEELPRPVHPPRLRRHAHARRRPDRHDAPAAHQHRLVRQHALAVHGDDGHVRERHRLLRRGGRTGRAGQEAGEDAEGESHSHFPARREVE